VRIEQSTVIKGNYHEGNNGFEECKSDDTTGNPDTNGPEQHGHPARRKLSDTSIATDDSEVEDQMLISITMAGVAEPCQIRPSMQDHPQVLFFSLEGLEVRLHHSILKRRPEYEPPTVNAAIHRKAMWLINNPSFDLLIVACIGANCVMLVMTPSDENMLKVTGGQHTPHSTQHSSHTTHHTTHKTYNST